MTTPNLAAFLLGVCEGLRPDLRWSSEIDASGNIAVKVRSAKSYGVAVFAAHETALPERAFTSLLTLKLDNLIRSLEAQDHAIQ